MVNVACRGSEDRGCNSLFLWHKRRFYKPVGFSYRGEMSMFVSMICNQNEKAGRFRKFYIKVIFIQVLAIVMGVGMHF